MAEYQIELRPRISESIYNKGEKVRGDRELWVNGVRWGYACMKSHGPRGVSFEFYDFEFDGIHARYEVDGEMRESRALESCRGYETPTRWQIDNGQADQRDTPTRIRDKALELIKAGRLIDPAEMARRREIAEREWAEKRRARHGRDALMLEALASILKRDDLSNAERIGLGHIWDDHHKDWRHDD